MRIMSLQETVSNNIKKLRRENGMTQAQLAEEVNVEVGTVTKWETEVRTPPVKQLELIALALNVTVKDLITSQEVKDQTTESLGNALSLVVNCLGFNTSLKAENEERVQLIKTISQLDKHATSIILKNAEGLLETQKKIAMSKKELTGTD